ncbi:MAG: J domain-containing protein [Candidatus Altiarchaeota archaeon]
MTSVTVHSHTIDVPQIKDSFSRRATQIKNKILAVLKNVGVPEDDVDITEERVPMRKAAADVSWYANGFFCHYSYAHRKSYIENLYVIQRILDLEILEVLEGKKPLEDFLKEFSEDHDIKQLRKEARKRLGVEEECTDISEIDTKYKKLAKEHHPDMPNGNKAEFKKLNTAHKILRKELE